MRPCKSTLTQLYPEGAKKMRPIEILYHRLPTIEKTNLKAAQKSYASSHNAAPLQPQKSSTMHSTQAILANAIPTQTGHHPRLPKTIVTDQATKKLVTQSATKQLLMSDTPSNSTNKRLVCASSQIVFTI